MTCMRGAVRPRYRQCLPGAVVLAATTAIVTTSLWPGAARAEDLPVQLVAASRLIPVGPNERQVCIPIQGLGNQGGSSVIPGRQRSVGDGAPSYSAATKGAYLGNGPASVPAPPLVQALLDAGAARRISLYRERHYRPRAMVVPQLQDLGTVHPSGPPAPSPPPPVDQIIGYQADAYLVAGPDEELFKRDPTDLMSPQPPYLAAAPGDTDAPPPGVWRTNQVCYALIPDRVLEYADFETHDNGVSEVTAAVLFRPERVRAWISDPRVIDALRPNMKPLDVRVLAFRNDGDGWRPNLLAFTKLGDHNMPIIEPTAS